LARVEKGETIRSVADWFEISAWCVSKWGSLKRRTGDVAPGRVGGHKKRALSGEIAEWLCVRMRASAFTLRGLVAELAERGVKTQARAVWVFARADGLSYKKNARRLGAVASGRRPQANAVEGSPSRRRS